MCQPTFPSTRVSSDMVRTVSAFGKSRNSVVVNLYFQPLGNVRHYGCTYRRFLSDATVWRQEAAKWTTRLLAVDRLFLQFSYLWVSVLLLVTPHQGRDIEAWALKIPVGALSHDAALRDTDLSNACTSWTGSWWIIDWPLGVAKYGQLPSDAAADAWPGYDTCPLTGRRCTWYEHRWTEAMDRCRNLTRSMTPTTDRSPTIMSLRWPHSTQRKRERRDCSDQSTMISESGHCYTPVLHLSTEISVLTHLVVKSSDISKYQKDLVNRKT